MFDSPFGAPFTAEPHRMEVSMRLAICGDLKKLLAENFHDFRRLIAAARTGGELIGFVGPLQHRFVEYSSELGKSTVDPDVAKIIKIHVKGDGIEMIIDSDAKEEAAT